MASSINASTSGAGGIITTADNTGILNIQTAGTNAVTVNASQNVGIGTTSPSGKFHVANANTAGTSADNLGVYFSSINRNCDVYIQAKNTEGSKLNFGDGDNASVGRISYEHSTNHMAFDINAAERMRIDSSGNVGIGTTSPTGNLDIASSSNVNVYIRQTTGVCNTRIKSDSTNAAIGTSTNHQFSLLQNNTEGLTIDTSQNLKFNSGYGSVATAYGCRAWVNFNGTSTVAIRASGNVSSITDNGTGEYTINFTTAMPDANYATVLGGNWSGTAAITSIAAASPTYSTSAVKVQVVDRTGASQDISIVSAAIIR